MLDNITEYLTSITGWMSYVAIASLIFFIVSLIFIPKFIASIPSNYFIIKSSTPKTSTYSLGRLFVSIFRNIIGIFLIFCGVVMLITPGQGLLTILAGIFILDFLEIRGGCSQNNNYSRVMRNFFFLKSMI